MLDRLGPCGCLERPSSRSRIGRQPGALRVTSSGNSAGTDCASALAADQALIQKYCVTCHNARVKTAGLSLEGANPAEAASHADLWEKVAMKLRGGMMPPQGMPRPDAATLEAFATTIEKTIDDRALRSPDPGHKPVHRLNRTEYGNAVRDLLDLDVDVTSLLPADDESHGFDNIAGVLRVSPLLLEQYLAAARTISSLAVGTDTDLVRSDYPRATRRRPGGSRRGTAARHARRPALQAQLPAGRRVRIQHQACSATSSAT